MLAVLLLKKTEHLYFIWFAFVLSDCCYTEVVSVDLLLNGSLSACDEHRFQFVLVLYGHRLPRAWRCRRPWGCSSAVGMRSGGNAGGMGWRLNWMSSASLWILGLSLPQHASPVPPVSFPRAVALPAPALLPSIPGGGGRAALRGGSVWRSGAGSGGSGRGRPAHLLPAPPWQPRRPARSSHRRLRPDLAPSPGRAVSSACREPRKSRRVHGKVPLSEREGHLGAALSGCVVLREGEARGSLSRRGRWGGGTRGPRGGRWCGAVCVKARWGCSWRPCGLVLRATLVSGQRTFLHPPALGGSVCAVSELC